MVSIWIHCTFASVTKHWQIVPNDKIPANMVVKAPRRENHCLLAISLAQFGGDNPITGNGKLGLILIISFNEPFSSNKWIHLLEDCLSCWLKSFFFVSDCIILYNVPFTTSNNQIIWALITLKMICDWCCWAFGHEKQQHGMHQQENVGPLVSKNDAWYIFLRCKMCCTGDMQISII